MKHLHKKNISKAVLSLVVTVVLFVLCSLNVFAAQNYDGGVGVGGGGSSALAGGTYSIGTGFSSKVYDKPILGLRFSVYNKETDTTYGSIDIYRSSCSNISNFVNRNKASVKYNHKQLEKSWTSIGLYWTTGATFSYDSNVGVSLPATTSGIEAWQWNFDNTSAVLRNISGAPSHILNFQYGDRLLIEPIYPLEVGGSTYVLTVAEIAVLGAKTYGTGAISPKTNSNTWNFIAYHTNMYFPGSLMTTSGDSGLYGATSQPTSCIPFPQILTGGYGLSVVWKTDEAVPVNKYTVTYDANGGTGAPGNQTFTVDEWGNLSTQTPTREGYKFVGWQDHNDYTLNGTTWHWYAFNAPFYANTYSDVFAEYDYDKANLISHWVANTLNGNENRTSSEIFNVTEYKNMRPDVNNAYGGNKFNCALHWNNLGYNEGSQGIYTAIDNNSDVYPAGANVRRLGTDGQTVVLTAKWEKISQQTNLILVPLEPNAPYREGTEVITSCWIVNPSDKDYTPSDNIKVQLSVYNENGTVIKTALKQIVVPARDKNLVYFKWQVPTGLNYKDVTVNTEINDGNTNYGLTSNTYATTPYTYFTTPDTKYEARAPIGFSVKRSPGSSLLHATWWEWTYNGGVFKKINYAIGNRINTPTVSAPTSKSAKFVDGKLVIRSGYGFDCSFTSSVFTPDEYQTPNSESFTVSQYSYALFPEFSYRFRNDYARTFEEVSGVMKFYNSDNRADRHYTPIYFPDGSYYFNIVASDSWTPAGMIQTAEDVEIGIDGNMYDDWYITHNLP